jgi:SAM-dependent methyltransferase
MQPTREYKSDVSSLNSESSSTSAFGLQTSNDRRPLLYRVLFDLTRHMERAARGVFALAAGTLRRADLLYMSQRAWRNFNSESAAKGELYPWERDVYDRFLKKADRILIVGSGTGRDLMALAGEGHEMVGIEPAPEAAATSRRLLAECGHSAQVIEAFFEDAALPGMFDAIVFSYLCYSHIPQTSHRIAALRQAARHLSADGRIIITYLSARAPFRTAGLTLMRLAARLTRSDWRPEQNDLFDRLDDDERLVQYEHWFPPGELESEMSAAGLKIIYHRLRPEMPTVVLMRADAEIPTAS